MINSFEDIDLPSTSALTNDTKNEMIQITLNQHNQHYNVKEQWYK